MKLEKVYLPKTKPNSLWDVEIEGKIIQSIQPSQLSDENRNSDNAGAAVAPPSLILPSLCHPHIHLDKPYLLTSHAPTNHEDGKRPALPDYSDLIPKEGTFSEALSNTSKAKQRYTLPDLLLRGRQLLMTSLNQGVTHVRAFVEVDHVTNHMAVEAGCQLRRGFAKRGLHVQLVVFAQDPIFSPQFGPQNRKILEEVLDKYAGEVEVLGTTPYVEDGFEQGLENVKWAVETAMKRKLHLDFHLDYNLDGKQKAMVWDVLRILKEKKWTSNAENSKTIVLGHCSHLTLFSHQEMKRLADQIHETKLPIHFVGLPTSDLFMMGRSGEGDWGGQRPRGTLHILSMIKDFGMDCCIGVNNVGNAFTPWGSGDPLALACMGVGIYQGGTIEDAEILYECISTRARFAIGLQNEKRQSARLGFEESGSADLIEIKNRKWMTDHEHGQENEMIPARQRIGVQDVVWDPPEECMRHLP